jgi:hypothetical protein
MVTGSDAIHFMDDPSSLISRRLRAPYASMNGKYTRTTFRCNPHLMEEQFQGATRP